jgi:hypothetical protein
MAFIGRGPTKLLTRYHPWLESGRRKEHRIVERRSSFYLLTVSRISAVFSRKTCFIFG